eukprot:TRINITY_DN645_c3_g1_i2.p1 TRINITY_DN645_c3_g1~~TRINITY_DN645_c3_g1_i2.p1  ORF type:complete len:375 (+),score=101.74 TRINITY_DN645_c3_g1_i2:191-1315(+)
MDYSVNKAAPRFSSFFFVCFIWSIEKSSMEIPDCSSCKKEKSSIQTREHPYCGGCFDRMFIRRIKIGLSGPGKMKYSSNAIIHVRGTPSCFALLSILAEGKEGKGRKTNFNMSLIHLFDANDSVHVKRMEFIKSHPLVHAFGGVRLEPWEADQRLLERISDQVLVKIAKEMGAEFVISTENGMDISQKAFMHLLESRGNMIGHGCKDVSSVKWIEPTSELKILRPMRDVLPKEVMYFNHRRRLQSFHPLKLLRSPGKWTTSRRTELFLTKLQSTFPGTIHTVLRSLSHILPSDVDTMASESDGETVIPCSICNEPVIGKLDVHEEASHVLCSRCQSTTCEERRSISAAVNELHHIRTCEEMEEKEEEEEGGGGG